MTTVGPEIRTARERQSLSVEDLAHHACVNVERLRRYEGLVDAQDVSPDQLLTTVELERVVETLGVTMPRLLQKALARSGAHKDSGQPSREPMQQLTAERPPIVDGIQQPLPTEGDNS